ncbi:hypothetical protein N7447_002290 [Penicillium robsamsonii]|uniref:uncharacterized protein n=1 Tax=Penicillium robsamsonii TaxID=1792511 RepID=UPI00254783A5|nr:uncharacterized protein N7447_002290 [Penicillium robsamsonii]KAJ5836264.1 hypothetical protein N7447_002290 [Penicillium robsamsonii]
MPSKRVASRLCPGVHYQEVGSYLKAVSRTCPFSRDYHANDIGKWDESPPPPFCLSLSSSSPVFATVLSRSFPTPERFVLSTFF